MTTMINEGRIRQSRQGRVVLFPTCDRDGVLLEAMSRKVEGPVTRADAMLFGWMLGLDAAIDAVGAARAVIAVAIRQPDVPRTEYRQELLDGLERFVADRGRVASLSNRSSDNNVRRRRLWRDAPDPLGHTLPSTATTCESASDGESGQ